MYIRLSPNNLRFKLVVLLNKLLDNSPGRATKMHSLNLDLRFKKIILKYRHSIGITFLATINKLHQLLSAHNLICVSLSHVFTSDLLQYNI